MRSGTSSFLARGSVDAYGPVNAGQEHPSYRRERELPVAPAPLAALLEAQERWENERDGSETTGNDAVSSGGGGCASCAVWYWSDPSAHLLLLLAG